MSLIPDILDRDELHPPEITSEEWAELLAMDADEFREWYESAIDFYDDAYPVHDRAFAYGRVVAEWRSFVRYSLDAFMTREPHSSHAFLYQQAQRYLLKAEALELVAECEGFDLAAERYQDEVADEAKIADILANPDAIAAKLAECAALPDNDDSAESDEGAA